MRFITTVDHRLLAELNAYRDAAEYDATMSGPLFKGWNRSQLDRARKMTEAARGWKITKGEAK